jgi:hypothetical protein
MLKSAAVLAGASKVIGVRVGVEEVEVLQESDEVELIEDAVLIHIKQRAADERAGGIGCSGRVQGQHRRICVNDVVAGIGGNRLLNRRWITGFQLRTQQPQIRRQS